MGRFDWFSYRYTRGKEKTLLSYLLVALTVLFACSKDVGKNPLLAYSDAALLDSCKQSNFHYYQNNPVILPSNAPHGPHQLRFNHIAYAALGTDGKLAQGKVMPSGAMVVKDVYQNGQLSLYAFMYKRSGTWLWGEISPNGNIQYSVNKNVSICTNCHSGTDNRDYLLSFR